MPVDQDLVRRLDGAVEKGEVSGKVFRHGFEFGSLEKT